MSSNLTSFVPVLDGTNYQQWAAQMQSYLMSQGQWPCVTKNPPAGLVIAPPPSSSMTKKPADDDEADPSTLLTDADAIAKWDENNTKAVGNIRLRLHHTISYQFNDVESAKQLWVTLHEQYGMPGPSRVFLEFKGAMDTVIPNNQDPSPAIDKMLAHFTRLWEYDFVIPDKMQILILISKAPWGMEPTIQIFLAAGKERFEDKDALHNIIKAMNLSWETSQRTGSSEIGRASCRERVSPYV